MIITSHSKTPAEFREDVKALIDQRLQRLRTDQAYETRVGRSRSLGMVVSELESLKRTLDQIAFGEHKP